MTLAYTVRGLAYWVECANPFSRTVTARGLPLGLRIHGYKRDGVGRGLYRRKVHEPGLTGFLLERFAGAGARHFLDLGGNLGYFACLLGKLAGASGRVITVEPEPLNRKLLEENLRLNGLTNVTVHACAVGAAEGTAKLGLYKPSNRGRHSMVDLESCKSSIEVPVHTLDALLRDSGVESWDLLKIDVEGYEPFVFDGAAATLAKTQLIAMEYLPSAWRKAGIEPASVFAKLRVHFPRVSRFEGAELHETSWDELARRERVVDLLLERAGSR